MTGRAAGLPHFPTGVIHDPALAGEIQGLHMALQSPSCDKLERDVRLLCILARLIRRHAENRPAPPRLWPEPGAVGRVMEYIQAHHDQALSLQALARVAGLSRFHLVRLFHRQVGLPPHAYLSQVRVFRAKQLLAGGMPIAEAALSVGFCDQSHLNRAFKRTLGITPGAYRNGVQEKLPARL
jgi:AraC-like DNA-binding protein